MRVFFGVRLCWSVETNILPSLLFKACIILIRMEMYYMFLWQIHGPVAEPSGSGSTATISETTSHWGPARSQSPGQWDPEWPTQHQGEWYWIQQTSTNNKQSTCGSLDVGTPQTFLCVLMLINFFRIFCMFDCIHCYRKLLFGRISLFWIGFTAPLVNNKEQ